MIETIPAKELDRYVEDRSVLIVDLRSPEEFADGHIRGAVNVPYGMFRDELKRRRYRAVILYCERGGMSMQTARSLAAQGYRAKSVVGGFGAYRGKNIVRL